MTNKNWSNSDIERKKKKNIYEKIAILLFDHLLMYYSVVFQSAASFVE